jgi:hypothetical protein
MQNTTLYNQPGKYRKHKKGASLNQYLQIKAWNVVLPDYDNI